MTMATMEEMGVQNNDEGPCEPHPTSPQDLPITATCFAIPQMHIPHPSMWLPAIQQKFSLFSLLGLIWSSQNDSIVGIFHPPKEMAC